MDYRPGLHTCLTLSIKQIGEEDVKYVVQYIPVVRFVSMHCK